MMTRIVFLALFTLSSTLSYILLQTSTVSAVAYDRIISTEVELMSIDCGIVTVSNTGIGNINSPAHVGLQPGITQASQALSTSGLPTLNNMGTVNINGPGGRLDVISAGTLQNDSVVNIKGGFLNLSGGTVTNNNTINLASGGIGSSGTFNGPGTINMTGGTLGQGGNATIAGTVINSGGKVQPGFGHGPVFPGTPFFLPAEYFPRTLTLGSYVQNGAGRLELGIGGLLPGSQYDQLKVNRPISINGGSIVVSLVNNFQPKVGDKFDILTGQIQRISLSSPISLPPLPNGEFWGRANFGRFFELSVQQVQPPPVVGSPEPCSSFLVAAGLVWLIGLRWKGDWCGKNSNPSGL